MKYIIWKENKCVYSDGDSVKHLNIDDPSLRKAKDVRIALTSIIPQQVKSLPLEVQSAALRAFSSEYLVCFEKLKEDTYQVFGNPDSTFENIKNIVLPVNIDRVVPYPAAIRALIQKKVTLKPETHLIFIEDDGQDIIFTVFQGNIVTAPRILARDNFYPEFVEAKNDYLKDEKETDISFKIITNKPGLSDTLKEEKEPDFEVFETWHMSNPAVEGLKLCDTGVQFILYEAIEAKRALQKKKRQLATLFVAGAVGIVSLMFYAQSVVANKLLKQNIANLGQEKTNTQKNLLTTYRSKYFSIIKSQQSNTPQLIYNFIMQYSPTGFEVRNISIKRRPGKSISELPDLSYQVVFFAIPRNMSGNDIKAAFPACTLADTIISGQHAYRVSYGVRRDGTPFPIKIIEITKKGRTVKKRRPK